MTKYIVMAVFLTLGLIARAHAAVVLDDNTGDAIFKIDGKTFDAAQAAMKAPSSTITKCTPIKGAVTSGGNEATAYKCVEVVYACSPKTGNCHWKRK